MRTLMTSVMGVCAITMTTLVAAPAFAGPVDGSSAAGAPTPIPAVVAERAVVEFRDITFRTTRDLDQIGLTGVARIKRLIKNGASQDQINQLGDNLTQRLTERAATGLGNLNAVDTKADTKLGADGGTDAQKARVTGVFDSTTARINAALQRAKDAITKAIGSTTQSAT